MNRRTGPPPEPALERFHRGRGRLRSARREVGFTLVEIVVAFVLLALVLSTGFEIFSAGLKRAGDLEDQSRAIVIAQAKLAAAGLDAPLAEGVTQGEDGHFHWTLAVSPSNEAMPPPEQPQPGPGTFMLYRVDVRVAWAGADQRSRGYSLAGLAIGQRQ